MRRTVFAVVYQARQSSYRYLSDVDFECSRFEYIVLMCCKSDAKVRIDVAVRATPLCVCLENAHEFHM